MWSLGIDIGGTFTDIVARGEERTVARKVLTTHDDPARGVEAGVAGMLADARIDPGAVERLVHATTLFTNTLIERKGACTGLITTRGFRDTLEIGRERKYELYDLAIARPPPLVPRDRRLEATERVGANGEVLERLDPRSLDEAMSELARHEVDAVAIAFLHAYANPEHERAARDRLSGRFPGVSFTISSEVAPEIREFERISTTVANAYLMPLAARYVGRLADRVAGRGVRCRLLLMLSSGGLTDVEEARRFPVRMLESGPAAGAIAAAWFGARAGHRRPARVRHGRHHGQALPRRRRGTARHPHLRGLPGTPLHRRERAAAQDLGPGAHRDRGGRGQHRPRGRARTAQGRAGERGLRARARLLRARRPEADGHRRRPRAGLPRPGVLRRRRHAPSLRRGR